MGKVRLLDGSFATALKELGFDADKHAMWTGEANRTCTELVAAVYKKFLNCGVDIITTNTYHACEPHKKAPDFQYDPNVYIGNAVKLLNEELKSFGGKNITVLGSISCFGATLRNASEYTGNYVDELPGIHEMPKLVQDGEHLRHGESLKSAVEKLISHNKIVGIGINCTDASNVPSLLSSIIGSTKGKDVFVYPNCGFESPTMFGDLSRSQLSSHMKQWIDLGATVVGGCCGTSTAVIEMMRNILDNELQ